VGSDVRALDWLSPTVAIGGTRRRAVLLWDSRTGGASTRFQHSSGVTALRSVGNGSQMVVCGFDGMATYDVRMPTRQQQQQQAWRASWGAGRPSPALLRIPFRTERPSVAMDVSAQANLVAIADDANVVRLHSLLSGRLMGELGGRGADEVRESKNKNKNKDRDGGSDKNKNKDSDKEKEKDKERDNEHYTRLRFLEDPDGKPTLLACRGPKLLEWSWGGVEDDEG